MAFPGVPGAPQHSGTLIPTIWAKQFLKYFYIMTVLAAISNTDYEGVIKDHGDQVKINLLPEATTRKLIKGQDLIYDEPESSTRELDIDQGRYFAFNADYIDTAQSGMAHIEAWAKHYAAQMKIDIEKDVFAEVFASVAAENMGATACADSLDINLGTLGAPFVPTKLTILDWIVDIGDVLDQQNIPDDQRAITLPTWACAMIKKSDIRNATITGDGNKSTLRNGRIGMIDNTEIFSARTLSTGTDGGNKVWNALATHKSALTFATQLTKQERFKNQKSFGESIRALESFGFEMIQPTAACHLYIAKAA